MRVIRRKLNSPLARKGFTLVEMLVAIVVCLLATAMATLAIDTSSKALTGQTRKAEAETLCSTLSMALSDELRLGSSFTAVTGSDTDAANFTYFSQSRKLGSDCTIVNDATSGQIVMQAGGTSYPLVPEKSYTHKTKAKCTLRINPAGDSIRGFVCVYIDNGGTQQVLAEKNFTVEPMTN